MRKLIALIFAVLLVFPLLLAAQVSISVSSWALDRQFYIDVLEQEQVYSSVTSVVLMDNLIYGQLNLPLEVNARELEPIIKEVLTPEYMRIQISAYINSLFDYLQGKTESFAPTLDLVPLKTAFQGEQQDLFLTAFVAALPICEPGQAPGFVTEGSTSCKPAGISDEQLIEYVLKPILPGIISMVPDTIPLTGVLTTFQETTNWRSFIPGMAVPASIILGMLMLGFIAVSFWYITALISDSSWHVRLQWLGWMLLIPSILTLLIGFSDQSGISAYWIRFGLERTDLSALPFGSSLGDTLQVIISAALPKVVGAFKTVGGISIGAAVMLIFWGLVTPQEIARTQLTN